MTALSSMPAFGPRPGSAHLGERIDALADGQVAPDERDLMLAHISGCPSCADDLSAARRVKARLGSLPAPEVSLDLTSRLLSLPGFAPERQAPAHSPLCAPSIAGRVLPTAGTTAAGQLPGLESHRRRLPGGATSVGLLVGAALLVAVPAAAPTSSRPSPRAPRPPVVRAGAELQPPSALTVESSTVLRERPLTAVGRSSAGRVTATTGAFQTARTDVLPIEMLAEPMPPLLAGTLHR